MNLVKNFKKKETTLIKGLGRQHGLNTVGKHFCNLFAECHSLSFYYFCRVNAEKSRLRSDSNVAGTFKTQFFLFPVVSLLVVPQTNRKYKSCPPAVLISLVFLFL